MICFYICCFILAFVLFLWQSVSDERQSVTQQILLVVVVIANGGFLAFSGSDNLQEAILATKVLYVGACFLPMLYFITVCEVCRVSVGRMMTLAMYIIQGILYGFICTIGYNDWFYKTVELHTENGICYLTKSYGIMHMMYPVTMYLYFALAFIVVIRTLSGKKSVDARGLIIMLLSFLLGISCYVIERVSGLKLEVMPLAYVILMTGSVFQTYQSNLFTIEENKSIINEQLSQVGFIAFDCRLRYMGCNRYAEKIFPEVKNYTVGKEIADSEYNFKKYILDYVTRFAHCRQYGKMSDRQKKNSFEMEGHSYDCKIHILQNYYNKCVGFAVEIKDETEHYKALELFNDYNRMLTADVNTKTKQIRDIQEKIILGMAQIIESRDMSTGGHIKRTRGVVQIFAEELLKTDYGFDEEFLQLVIRSAPIHDLGKIGVDDAILRKQGKFTDEEYNKMKEHSEIGARIVQEVFTDVEKPRFVEVAVNVAHYHHEKVNGKGYPEGRVGDEIPVEARIMALADVFDALVSKRCYKDAFSFDEAFSIIKKDAGIHFDAKLTEVFLRCRKKLEWFYNHCGEKI